MRMRMQPVEAPPAGTLAEPVEAPPAGTLAEPVEAPPAGTLAELVEAPPFDKLRGRDGYTAPRLVVDRFAGILAASTVVDATTGQEVCR
jgi:hypothetical protein